MMSDDGIVPAHALTAELDALDDGHPVATGYSNLDSVDFRVNLADRPFENLEYPEFSDYKLIHFADAVGWPTELIPTYFAGYALTGMSRDMWREFPFRVCQHGSWASDWQLCVRLQQAEIPIVAPKQAFTWHVKEIINTLDKDPRKRLLVGEVPAQSRYETMVAA
jgi:hypothetical protein